MNPNGTHNGTHNGHNRLDGLNLPPHNLEAERGVLGSLVLRNEVLHEVLPFLEAVDFYRATHRVIFEALRDLILRGEPADPLTIVEELARRGDRECGTLVPPQVIDLMTSVPHAANAVYYARIVAEKAKARRVAEACQALLAEVYSHDFTADELIASAERRVLALSEGRAEGRPERPIGELAAEALERIDRRSRHDEYGGVPSGLCDLDGLTDGFGAGTVTVLAARPSAGKTALALQIAQHAALSSGVPTLFVSLEMSGIELAERLLVSLSRVDGQRVRTGCLVAAELEQLRRAGGTLRECPHLAIADSSVAHLGRIASCARRFQARRGLGLMVLDYLQLVESDPGGPKGASRQEQVAQLSRRLKVLARELAVPVLCLSQINRQSEQREDSRPRMSDLRESGAIEQDADMVLLLHRPEYFDPNDRPGEADLIVAKNRNGATGTVRLAFRKQLMRFDDFHPGAAPGEIPIEDF